MSIKDFLCGDTVKVRWINSGATPTAISFVAYNGFETLIESSTMIASGSLPGFYYYMHTIPSTPGYYVAEVTAIISGKPFKNREKYRAVLQDVN